MNQELHGVNPPVVTPLDEDGALDEPAFRDEIRYHLDAGVSGVVIGGSTGEGMRMNESELERIYEVAVDEVNGVVPVVAGVIGRQTQEVVAKGKRARDAGADFLLATPPTGYSGSHMASDDSAREYYRALGDATGLPIVLYDVMSLHEFSPELVGDFVENVPEVVGIKVSSSLANLTYYTQAIGDDGFVLGGLSIAQFPQYTLGIDGGVVGISSVCPRLSVQIWEAVQRGDLDRARELHFSIVPLIRVAMEEYEYNFPGGEKMAIEALGRNPGKLRHPYEMDESKRDSIEAAVDRMRGRGVQEAPPADD